MILLLDTSGFDYVRFALINDKVKEKKYSLVHVKAADTLKHLSKFLGKKKLEGITKVVVVSGPGSFAGIRVGIALAQGMSLPTKIPVYAISSKDIPDNLEELARTKKLKKITENFDPDYGAAVNITIKKKP